MEISYRTALEILGLREDFSKDELNQEFRRLSKLVHPDVGGDANLFKLLMCCKETLSTDEKTQKSNNTHTKNGRWCIDLNTLYSIYYMLNEYTRKYNIINIRCTVRIHIIPYRKRNQCISRNIEIYQPFDDFCRLGFTNFVTTIDIPEDFKSFKRFFIQIEFMEKTYNFKLSTRKPFHIVKYEHYKFNSIIELQFE